MSSILMVGGQSRGQSLKSAADGFVQIGVKCDHVLTRRIYRQNSNHDEVYTAIMAAKPEDYGAVLLWNPKGEIRPHIVQAISQKNPKTIYWTIDDPDWQAGGKEIRTKCQIAFSCCEDSTNAYIAEGQEAYTMYPPVNVRPGAYNWGTNLDWACKVGFMASNCYRMEDYPEMVASREDLVRAAMKHTDDWKVFGWWDERPTAWATAGGLTNKGKYGGWIRDEDIAVMTRSVRINLNSHIHPHGLRYYNDRVMQTLGTGGFMLCDRIEGIERDFEDGVHLALYSSVEEFEQKLAYYLKNVNERQKIAQQGQMVACALYSNIEFARQTMRIIGK